MENKIDSDTVRTLLQKICSYDVFKKSPRYTHFLTYLVEQALVGNNLKEQTIGIELFERNYNEDKNDGIVRVYMYNLRKKLKSYYSKIGKNDAIIFTLEKGSYDLKFIANENINESKIELNKFTNTKKKTLLIITGLLLISIIASYYLFFNKTLYCWDAFMKTNTENTCILADQVVLNKDNGTSGNLKIIKEINSSSDFLEYGKKHAIDSLQLADYTFFTKSIPYSLIDLTKWFYSHNQDFNPLPESEFRYEETKRGNIIYIGQYKTMSVSKEIFLKNSKSFKANYNSFNFYKNGETKQYSASFKVGIRDEYAMVSYMPLDNDHKALYFVSNNDIGTMATIHNFTKLEFLKEFYKNLPSTDSYFNALFKVEGIGRTETSCTLVELEIIE
ncbi:helix-turn-helix domain-containing protein [Lutibacter citreus]|uniref:helix-turn-helix domain-containing protein n=1 Tax=Lutibacter citreus TaxID=2138210 RepID=UPI000DBE9ADB|nr:helix-turn-helix domain-containing protein [Lutibacter citreus]